jgi:hypothetical protein
LRKVIPRRHQTGEGRVLRALRRDGLVGLREGTTDVKDWASLAVAGQFLDRYQAHLMYWQKAFN